MIETQLTRDLGITVPVIGAAMMHLGLPVLASAVSNAGGLGVLTGLTQPTPEALRKAIREMRTLTDKPFAVNLTFLPTISPPPYLEYAQVIIDEGVKVVETAGSAAAAPSIAAFKKAGIYVMHKCTTIRHAKAAVSKMKVDCVSIDGFECAGHPGEEDIPGIVLLARAAQELKVPYVASGGFANGRQLAAALALGAQGINCGTRFQCTKESPMHQNIKEEMVKATENDTALIFRTLNNTARVYRNSVAKEVVAMEQRPGGCEFKDIQHLVSGARGRTVYEKGDVNAGIWTCGMSVGLIHNIPTCEELVREIEKEAEEIISNLQKSVKIVPNPSRQSKL